ncbi:MAG: phage tail fiber protein [Giesbergeria sp.]
MSKGNTAENDVLLHLFNATALSWAAITHLYVALHTADPGEGGSQTTSECAYGSYARVAVIRTGAGWTVSGNSSTNAAAIEFPECTSGSETITHVSVGTATSGAGQIVYSGALNASRSVSSGIQPRFAASGLTITED